MSLCWWQKGGSALIQVSINTTTWGMSLQNCVNRSVCLNKQWGTQERSEWQARKKNSLMFQKQPSAGIPQAGRRDNRLLALLCVLYVIALPPRRSQHSWVKRTFRTGVSCMGKRRPATWHRNKGNHWLLLSALFLLREILFEVVWIIWCDRSLSVCPVAITE